VVRELGIMHLVAGHETYKMAFGIVSQALGRIAELLVQVGGIICQMIFLVMDTTSYDLLLGLNFLIKIGAVMDMEKCRNPTLRECEDETHTLEMRTWESTGTPETSEFNCRGQNTLH
jgi:hypothetical protein